MESYSVGSTVETTVLLTMAGTPVTGVLAASVNISIKKAGQLAFQAMAATSANWIELGSGFYTLIFSPSITNTPGNFVYRVTGVGFDNLVFDQFNLLDPALSGSTQSYFQDSPVERTVFLKKAGVPALNVPPSSVVCNIKQAGTSAFSQYPLNSSLWKSLGSGYYTIIFSSFATASVGNFTYTLTSSNFDNFAYDEFVIVPKADVVINTMCVVSGSLINLGGNPANLIKVTARMVAFPAKFNGSILGGDQAYTFLDSNGKFSLPLLRGSTCIIEIPRAGIKSQINIPDQVTANLMDLLPPFAIDYSV